MPVSTILLIGAAAAVNLESKPIPVGARAVIREVRMVAKAKNLAALRRLMVAEFTWSFGGDPQAIPDH